MNKNVLTIGMVVGAIVSIVPSVNAQSVVDNPLWLAQSERNSSPSTPKADSQGCIYQKEVPGWKPLKICRNPLFNGIRIDACLFAYGSCNPKASAEEFCRLQGDGYTEYNGHNAASDRPYQTISITTGKIHHSRNLGQAPFDYNLNKNGRLIAFSYIRCQNPNPVANNKPKKQPDWHCDNYSNEALNTLLNNCQTEAKNQRSRNLSLGDQKFSLTDAAALYDCRQIVENAYPNKIKQCRLETNKLRNQKRCYRDTPLNKNGDK